MLAEEAQLAAQVLDEEPALVRAAVDVRRARGGIEPELPPGLREAVRPAGPLAEGEGGGAGRPHLVGRGPAPEPDCAHQPLPRARRLVVEAAAVERVQDARLRRELAEEEELRRE